MHALKTILKVMGLFVWALVIAEACVRLLDPQPLMPRYVTGTPWGVRGNIPGAVYRHRTPEVNVQYRINGQGLRADHDYPLEPQPGVCRVGLIGDSYFVGYEVELGDTVAQRLEGELKKRGVAAEVLNFSVSGFGTAEMLRAYEGQMRMFHPDLVILQWHVTDLEDNVRSGLYTVEGGQLRTGAPSYLPSIAIQDRLMGSWLYRTIADNSQLYSFFRERAGGLVKALLVWLRSRASPAPVAALAPVSTSPRESDQPGAELSGLLLRRTMQTVKADGADFLVVEVPDLIGREKLVPSWNLLPAELVRDVPVLHGASAFEPLLSPDVPLYYEKGHRHFSPLAAGALAAAIADRLAPLLPRGSCASRL